jgi:hypothetical protein
MSRRPPAKIDVSLFPFLSVLCTMIGVMMLLLLSVVGSRVLEAAAGPPSADEVRRQAAIGKERFEQLRGQIDQLETQLAAQRQARDELLALHSQLIDLLAAKEDQRRLKPAPDEPRRRGTRLAEKRPVRIVPDAERKVTKKPRFVEVGAAGLLAHPEKLAFAIEQLQEPGSPLLTFLEQLSLRRDTEYLLLLVHPNGAKNYQILRGHLDSTLGRKRHRFEIGVEPFAEEWLLADPDAGVKSSAEGGPGGER